MTRKSPKYLSQRSVDFATAGCHFESSYLRNKADFHRKIVKVVNSAMIILDTFYVFSVVELVTHSVCPIVEFSNQWGGQNSFYWPITVSPTGRWLCLCTKLAFSLSLITYLSLVWSLRHQTNRTEVRHRNRLCVCAVYIQGLCVLHGWLKYNIILRIVFQLYFIVAWYWIFDEQNGVFALI